MARKEQTLQVADYLPVVEIAAISTVSFLDEVQSLVRRVRAKEPYLKIKRDTRPPTWSTRMSSRILQAEEAEDTRHTGSITGPKKARIPRPLSDPRDGSRRARLSLHRGGAFSCYCFVLF